MYHSMFLALAGLVVTTGIALAGEPPSSPDILAHAHIRVLRADELFKQSKTDFEKLRVVGLLAAYPHIKGYTPPLADIDPNTPLEKVAFLTDYTVFESLLSPNTPLPKKDSDGDKFMAKLARSLVKSFGINEQSIYYDDVLEMAKRWYWNDALIEDGPQILFTIKKAGEGCVGYMAVRAWQQPGSRKVVLYPCVNDLFLSPGNMKDFLRPLGLKPDSKPALITPPLSASSWPDTSDCPSAALDIRRAVLTDGRYLVTAGTGNVYEVVVPAHYNFLDRGLWIEPRLEYRENAGFNDFVKPRFALSSRIILKRLTCKPPAR